MDDVKSGSHEISVGDVSGHSEVRVWFRTSSTIGKWRRVKERKYVIFFFSLSYMNPKVKFTVETDNGRHYWTRSRDVKVSYTTISPGVVSRKIPSTP